MRICRIVAVIFTLWTPISGLAQFATQHSRRQRIASELQRRPHSILLVHAKAETNEPQDGFRQDPFFYYFTGLENLVGALLAIDCDTGQSWLFLPTKPPFSYYNFRVEIQPGPAAEKSLGIDHVVDWSNIKSFLASRSSHPSTLYFVDGFRTELELPGDLIEHKSQDAPLWIQALVHQGPDFTAENASLQVWKMMAVQGSDELDDLKNAAKATIAALNAGMRAIHPGVSQRSAESAVDSACWNAGAHGSAFWPWVLAGESAVFPTPFMSALRYDHLDQTLRAGDLVRLDVGCEVRHYGGDLGRTVPVSGRFDVGQRETWEIYIDAYRAGARELRSGATPDQIYEVWRKRIVSHRGSAKSVLAQHAIDLWSERKNVPFWMIHTTNLTAGPQPDVLLEGSTINFEPMAAVDGQAFFTEDMYMITKTGAELLTPDVPLSADEIETAMARNPR